LPVAGIDVAPQGFGKFSGQIFTLALPKVGQEGIMANYLIQRVNPTEGYAASVFCTLPEIGEGKFSGVGVEARFGPVGSPFAGKLYVLTALNNTIHQVTADGKCSPFVTFDAERGGAPVGLVFTPDGKSMVVTVNRGNVLAPMGSAIVRVSPEGKVEDKPVVESKLILGGIDIAPEGFGAYAGQLFVVEGGSLQAPVPMTQSLTADGKVHRVAPEGQLHLVASGFVNPAGVRFIGKKLWVTDINGDFILGKRELPDGFIVEIAAH
jgi:DNA-binding beta-propeller fold protein YncE